MMDLEDLQSELLALRRLYGLLIYDEHYVEVAGSKNLDQNARRLLINLLDVAANKAFDAHAKILDTQFRATYSPWSMLQGQSRDGLNLQPFSLRNEPTDSAYPSLQKVDLLTGQEMFSEPANEVDLAGEPGVRLKRCRVCQKPKVKQLTKEISFGGSKALTSINRLQNQNHKRSWEVQNDPSIVGGSACPSNSPFLSNLIDQEDHISREASTKILQLESCISSLQVAAKHASFLKNDLENEPKQTGYFSVGRSDPNSSTSPMIWTPRDMAHQWYDQARWSTNELALQGPIINRMLPSSQITSQRVEEPVVNKTEMFNQIQNQYDYIPEESYYLFHSGGIFSNSKNTADKNRLLHRKLSSQVNIEQFNQLQMAKKEATRTSKMPELWDPAGYGTPPNNEQRKAKLVGQKKHGETYNDQMDHYKGKHKVVERRRLVSAATQRLSDSPVSSPNYSTQGPGPSPSPGQSQTKSSNSFSDSEGSSLHCREMYSGSSRSHEKSESEMNSVSSQDQSPSKSSSLESSGSMSRMTSEKGHKKGDQKEPKRKHESKMNTVSSRDQSPYMTSNSNESSRSRRMVPKKGNKKEQRRKSENKMNTVSNQDQSPYMTSNSNESTGSNPRKMVSKRGNPKEPKRKHESKMNTVSSQDQSSYTGSSSNKSLGSGGMVPTRGCQKGNPKEPKRKSESKRNTVSSQDSSSSNESSGSRSAVPEKGDQKGPKRKSESKRNTVSSQDSSSSNDSSGSSRTVPKKGHEKGNLKEPKRKSESKMNTVSSQDSSSSNESSGSRSRMMVLKKGHQKGNQKEPKRGSESKMNMVSSHDQRPSTSSSSSESTGSGSRMMVPKKVHQKGNQKESMKNQLARLSKLKDKVAIIFHQHHHHHHHHHHDGNDEDKQKKSLWKHAKNVIGQRSRRKKDETHGEHAVKKTEAHGEHAVKKTEAHGEHAVKKMEAHGEHAVKMIEAHGEHAVKKIEAHGEHAVKKIEANAIKKIEAHGELAVKKIESKALVVHKAAAKKPTHQLQLQALVGGLLKKSHHSLKPSKSKSVIKRTPSHVSGKQHGSGGGGGGGGGSGAKMGTKMQWWQMLRQQRKIKRIEKLRGKIDIGKKR